MLLPFDTNNMEKDTISWFGSTVQHRWRLQTVLWYDWWSRLLTWTDQRCSPTTHFVPDDPPEVAELLDYFDTTYVSGVLRHQHAAQNQAVRLVLRRNPLMFPPAIWNVHDATVNGDARTNNVFKGWNNKFFNLVGHAHPSFWRVIEWC